jgi:uncharacterized membrane protein (UPF0127 family)
MRVFVLLAAALFLCGCNSDSGATGEEAYRTTTITLPNGKVIRAELRGMMFRDSLPADRGMLFIHSKPTAASYWMYQVKIPLDIIFMDSTRRVLGISANTPPCEKKASECPSYGGYPQTQYVLELGGGQAAKNAIVPGSTLTF